ncbi:Sugar phosphate permease [Pseudomonas synxantha]|uniref:D-galactonate transporter n=1 Tax=Pseudomonas synxantha TaxID=47883 RepID=A0AAX3I8D3_9PSED|nr:MFS transporter [Pseudomonas synxantha]AZE66457.1 putative MFS-type transporter [Pseudomonas synxantha]KRP51824.1 DgoT [Pseudomonas synxantha]MDQ0980446.1 sugar phosphate permease [Pseudomonas synxantha]SDU39836.1 Sugar phosphate permease [Pseudomonas synxantha]VTR01150.1 d-galactonate transporter [Pseudomonas synxantha]
MAISQSAKPIARSSYRWAVAGLIFIIYTIAAADRANLGVAMPFIRKEFDMSNAEAGGLMSLFLLAYALAQIPAGFAFARIGVSKILPGAMILTSILTGLVGTAGSLLMLKIYRFGLGLAEGPLPISMTSTINNWFPAKEKGIASGIFLSAVKFGPVIVPPLCAIIISVWGWREIFIFFAVPGIILSLVWYFLVADHPSKSRFVNKAELEYILEQSDPMQANATDLSKPSANWLNTLDRIIKRRAVPALTSNGQVFKSWNIWGCATSYCFQLGVSSVLLTWIPTYLVTVKNFSIMNMGLVSAAPWVGAVLGNLLGGYFSDRFLGGRRKPGMLLSAIGTSLMMYLLINSPAEPLSYGLLLMLTGVVLSLGFSSYMSYPMGLASKASFPIANAIVNMVGQLGAAATPFLTGLLLDSYGWNYVFIFLAIGSFTSFILLLSIAEPIPGKQRG